MDSTLAQIINDLIAANQTIAQRDQEIARLKAQLSHTNGQPSAEAVAELVETPARPEP